jgi:hypothetical protein
MSRLLGNACCILGAAVGAIVCAQLLNIVAVTVGLDPKAQYSGVVGPTIAGLFWGSALALVAAKFYEPLKNPAASSGAVFTCGLALLALEFACDGPSLKFPTAFSVVAELVLSAGATLGLFLAASILARRFQQTEV